MIENVAKAAFSLQLLYLNPRDLAKDDPCLYPSLSAVGITQ